MVPSALQPDAAACGAGDARVPTIPSKAAPATSAGRWPWLLGPLALLATEIGLLTPKVEFFGPMARLASPAVAMALIFGGVLFLVVAGADLARLSCAGSPWARLAWWVVNLGSYGLFFKLSVALEAASGAGGVHLIEAAAWAMLAAAVGISAVMAWFSLGTVVLWVGAVWDKAFGCLVLGIILALITPQVQQLWLVVDGPAMRLAGATLELLHPGEVIVGHVPNGDPLLGLRDGVRLQITQYCAEMESLAALLLLGATLLAAEHRRVFVWRLLAVIAGATAALYWINALRLAMLVEIGAHTSAKVSVSLAHSRLSEMLLLGIGAAMLLLTRRWWRREGQESPGRAAIPVASVL